MDDRRSKNILKCAIFLAICLETSFGGTTIKPILCGETPSNMLECLNNPQAAHLRDFSVSSCPRSQATGCDKVSCAFRQNNWISGGKINKTELVTHFTKFGRDNPDVHSVMDHIVSTCLGQDLPAQGVFINCPAYDIMHCILTSYIQKSPPSKWVTSPECAYARRFASACPVCPSECFAPFVPYRSCNACYGLPTTS